MKTINFNQWLSRAVPIWQGEPHRPMWEVTDGDDSIHVEINYGHYSITDTDIVLTEQEAERLFDFVQMAEDDRRDDLINNWEIDDWEQGLFGYGY
jgi:hypothetical protein